MLDQLRLLISGEKRAPMRPHRAIGLADDRKREDRFGGDQQLGIFGNPRLELVKEKHRHFDGDASERMLGQA